MTNLQLGSTILLVIRLLLFANTGEVPGNNAPIVTGAAQDSGLMRMPGNGSDSVLVSLKSVHLLLHIAEIPDTNSVIARCGGDQNLGSRVEGQSIDGLRVAVSSDEGCLGGGSLASVQDLQRQVVRDSTDEALADGRVLDIVDDIGVMCVGSRGVQGGLARLQRLEIPQAHSLVLAARCKRALNVGVPGQAKSFLFVALESYLWVDLSVRRVAVLGPVKDQDIATAGQGGNQIRVLGAISSLVNLAGVVDLLDNVPLHCSLVALSVTTNLATLLIVVGRVRSDILGYLHLGNLEVVLLVVGGVSTDEGSVDADVSSLGLLDIGEPLDCESRPGEGGT